MWKSEKSEASAAEVNELLSLSPQFVAKSHLSSSRQQTKRAIYIKAVFAGKEEEEEESTRFLSFFKEARRASKNGRKWWEGTPVEEGLSVVDFN